MCRAGSRRPEQRGDRRVEKRCDWKRCVVQKSSMVRWFHANSQQCFKRLVFVKIFHTAADGNTACLKQRIAPCILTIKTNALQSNLARNRVLTPRMRAQVKVTDVLAFSAHMYSHRTVDWRQCASLVMIHVHEQAVPLWCFVVIILENKRAKNIKLLYAASTCNGLTGAHKP